MKTSDFLEFNSRTVRMKLDKAYFDKLNFKLGKDIKNCVIELVKKEISSSCDRNKDINYDDLEKITDKVFSSFFTNNILNIDFLCKIIEENFEFTDNYYDSLISLNKLAYIIEKAGVYLSEKYIFELMERSAVLRENVQTIVVSKKEDIQNGKLNNIIKNDIMLIIINVYLSMYSFNNSVKSDDIKYSSKTIKKQDKNIKEPSSKKRSKKDDSFKIVSELLCDYDYSSYVSFINSFSPLTFEEEIDLGKKIKQGDLKARDLLVYHNLKLVAIITQKYITSGVELLDLISEGNIGLIKAASKYDYTRGVRFSTVASWWINQCISRTIDNQSASIRIPVYKRAQITKYLKAKEQVTSKILHNPSIKELSYYLDMSIEEISYFENLLADTVSLNSILDDENNSELQDLILAPLDSLLDLVVVEDNKEEIRKLLDSENINAVEKEVVRRHLGFYGNEESFTDISKSFKLSRERIRVIFNTAINKIKAGENKEKYREFLGQKMYVKK